MTVPLLIGLLFGFALQKTGLGHYDVIVNQFRFKDNTMMKFMLSAIAAGSVFYMLFKGFGLIASAESVPPFSVGGSLLGGIIFGIGMAIAGTCPGTVVAGVGQGNVDYLTAGIGGFIVGGFIFGFFFRFFYEIIMSTYIGHPTLDKMTGINGWFFAGFFCIAVVIFWAVTLRNNGRRII